MAGLFRGVALCAALSLAAGTLSGCNTVKGVGKDMSSAGDAVTTGAGQVQNSLSGGETSKAK